MYKYAAGFGLIVAIVAGSYIYGRFDERKILSAKYDIAAQEAVDRAIAKERKIQEEYNDALRERLNEESDINSRLVADLNKLHKRESRRAGNKDKCTCKGATGAELSREDAEFLTREAARADKFRSAYKQ